MAQTEIGLLAKLLEVWKKRQLGRSLCKSGEGLKQSNSRQRGLKYSWMIFQLVHESNESWIRLGSIV